MTFYDLAVGSVSAFMGLVIGWFACDHVRRQEHLETNGRIIRAWISVGRRDVPPLGPYRTTEHKSADNVSDTKHCNGNEKKGT